jgi:hypothetical protein
MDLSSSELVKEDSNNQEKEDQALPKKGLGMLGSFVKE